MIASSPIDRSEAQRNSAGRSGRAQKGGDLPERRDGGASIDRCMLLRILAAQGVASLVVFLLIDWRLDPTLLPSRLAVALLGFAMCWTMYLILERIDPRGTTTRLAWVLGLSFPFTALFTATSVAVLYLTRRADGGCGSNAGCLTPVVITAIRYGASFLFVFIAWGATYMGMRSAVLALEAERQAGRARDEARVAQLRALHYQVNPHFLFNCLNSLGTLVDRGDAAAARGMIGEMGGFLRYGLAIDPLVDVDLEDEVEMQRRYLEIERHRFSHRLAIDFAIDPVVRRARIPPLLLQPLVENAVKHGVATTSAPVTVSLRASPLGDGRVAIVVEDDAPCLRIGAKLRMGIGLRNVAERLEARFENSATLSVGPRQGGGYRAEIAMPMMGR